MAAIFVVIAHFENLRVRPGDPSFAVRNLGRYGFLIFFTLSGFLLTYLMLKELRLTGKLDLRRFYLRRVLRTWPLYYFVLVLEFLVLPWWQGHGGWLFQHPDYPMALTLYLFMLPNVSMNFYPAIPSAIWTWAIGVHEQFYLFWPWVVRSALRIPLILLLPLALSVLGIAAEYLFPPEHVLARLFIAFPFQHIGIGGIYGLVAFSGHPLALRFRENLFRTSSQLILYVLLLSVMLYGVFFQILNFTVYSVLFGAMILNLAFNEKSLLRLDARILEHLGQRSFGIYMVHIFSLRYVLQFCRSQGLSWFWVYAFGITVSILLAELVYYVLERPFLKRKEKYRVIGSGTD